MGTPGFQDISENCAEESRAWKLMSTGSTFSSLEFSERREAEQALFGRRPNGRQLAAGLASSRASTNWLIFQNGEGVRVGCRCLPEAKGSSQPGKFSDAKGFRSQREV
jgi:hypothetical protein